MVVADVTKNYTRIIFNETLNAQASEKLETKSEKKNIFVLLQQIKPETQCTADKSNGSSNNERLVAFFDFV